MDIQTRDEKIEVITPSHFEHTLWMNELKFFEDEVKIYEHQLEKLIKTRRKEMLPRLEQFQNNFIRQKEVLDQLKRDIKVHEQKLAWTYMEDKEINAKFATIHERLREEMIIFKKIFNQIKKEFYAFLIKWK
jgi:hypothetical protein